MLDGGEAGFTLNSAAATSWSGDDDSGGEGCDVDGEDEGGKPSSSLNSWEKSWRADANCCPKAEEAGEAMPPKGTSEGV